MKDIRKYWLVMVDKEAMYISEKIVKIWGGNSIPKKGEIIPISTEKGKKFSEVKNIDREKKKIWLKGVKG